MQRRVGTLQELLCRYEEREERLRRALNKLRDMLREVRGSSDSVSLTGIEETLDGFARESTLERLQTTAGTLATASALSTLATTEGNHNTTTQGRLDTLQATAGTLATASALSTLAGRVGTASPLTGMHLWLNSMLDTMRVHAIATQHLGAIGMPEPHRQLFYEKMTAPNSTLRTDLSGTSYGRYWQWVIHPDVTDTRYTQNSTLIITKWFAGAAGNRPRKVDITVGS
jgi:hypothetical protein